MPRPKVYEDIRVQLQFRLPIELRDRLRRQADERMVATNFLIEKALEESLAKWEEELPPPKARKAATAASKPKTTTRRKVTAGV